MRTRLFSWLMAVLMCLPGTTLGRWEICYAQEQDLSGFLMSGDWAYGTFGSNDDYVYIGGYAGEDVNVTIPDEIEGKPVKQIFQNAFTDKTTLENVFIPGTVETIEDEAFSGCLNLNTVTFGDSSAVTNSFTIGARAFLNCTSLESFLFPDNTAVIGEEAFRGSGLTELNLPETLTEIGAYAFSECTGLTTVTIPSRVNLNFTGRWAFAKCVNICSVTIEDGVGDISEGMFSECISLSDITIPDSVTIIGASAFENCDKLSDVTMPNSIICIDTKAFYDCDGLEQLVIPDSVTTIEERAFAECGRLSQITLPTNLRSVGNEAFLNCTSLDNVVIPYGTETIRARVFQGCTQLKSIRIPASVANIYENALESCHADLTVYTTEDAAQVIYYATYEQNIPYIIEEKEEQEPTEGDWRYHINEDDTATIIRYIGEEGDVQVPDVIAGYPVTAIGAYTFLDTFHGSIDIRKVTIPDGVTSIGDSAFNSGVSFQVRIPKSVTAISTSAFSGCDVLTVYTEGGADEVVNYLILEQIPYVISVTDITLSKNTLSIQENNDAVLEVTLTPSDAGNSVLTWSSTNEEVAWVEDGRIIACQPGTTTITVSFLDEFTGETISASCEVTVTAAPSEGGDGSGDENQGEDDPPATDQTPGTGNMTPKPDKTTTPKALTAPKISSLTAKNKGVTVKWNKIKNASGYYVYCRAGKGSWKKTATVKKSATNYTDKTAVKNGMTYQYRIYAYTTSGKTTVKSKASAAKKIIYLTAPRLSGAKNNKTKAVTVKYGKNSKASGYEICYSTSAKFAKGNTVKRVSSAKSTSKILKKLKKGKTYAVRVRAFRKSGKTTFYSSWSNSRKVKISK